jgi:hypothetical protein
MKAFAEGLDEIGLEGSGRVPQEADPAYPLGLLRARTDWPSSRAYSAFASKCLSPLSDHGGHAPTSSRHEVPATDIANGARHSAKLT